MKDKSIEGKMDTAFIMAGGKGSRMNPNGAPGCSKPMRKVLGIPLIVYSIKALYENGVKKIFIVYHKSGRDILDIKKYLTGWSVDIYFIEDKKQIGSLYSFTCIKPYIQGAFIMADADVIVMPDDLRQALDSGFRLKQRDPRITVLVGAVKAPSIADKEILAVRDEIVVDFCKNGFENKINGTSYYQGGMLYVWYQYPESLINEMLQDDCYKFSEFFRQLVQGRTVGVMYFEDIWDVDTKEDIYLSEKVLKTRNSQGQKA